MSPKSNDIDLSFLSPEDLAAFSYSSDLSVSANGFIKKSKNGKAGKSAKCSKLYQPTIDFDDIPTTGSTTSIPTTYHVFEWDNTRAMH